MKIYTISGWWSQPNFYSLVFEREKERKGPLIWQDILANDAAFTGIIVVNDDGTIDKKQSVIYDSCGIAWLDLGKFSEEKGEIFFIKCYKHRNDGIEYYAEYDKESQCWKGHFAGDEVGKGTTKFILTEWSEKLLDFKMGLPSDENITVLP